MKSRFIGICLATVTMFLAQTPVFGQFFLNWEYFNYVDDIRQSGNNPSMKVDDAGTIHISYWNENIDKLVYAYRPTTSGTYTFEHVDSSSLNGHVSALELDSQGDVHIAYFENENAQIRIKYASRLGPNSWSVDTLPVNTQFGWGIGDYGPYAQTVQAEFLKQSIDLAIDTADNPKICFFAPYFNPNFVASCGGYYRDYELRLYNAYKNGNSWVIRSFEDYKDRFKSCFGAGPIPRGSRYGEFCSMVIDNQNNPHIFTNSFHNREVLRMDATNDSIWAFFPVDSALSIFDLSFQTSCWSWAMEYFKMESISSTRSADGSMHLVYTTGINYGKNFFTDLAKFNTVVYMQFDPSGNIVQRYQLYPDHPWVIQFGNPCDTLKLRAYHSYSSVATRSADSVYMAFGNRDSSYLIFSESVDSGKTWAFDTVRNTFPVTESPLEINGDSIYLLTYDQDVDRIILYMRHIGGGAWTEEEVTFSEARGRLMDAKFELSGADTIIHMAFSDDLNDKIYYGSGTLNGTMTWMTEEIDPGNVDFNEIRLAYRPSNGDPFVLYTRGASEELILARRDSGAWSYEVIDDSSNSLGGDIIIGSDDTIRLAFSTNVLTDTIHPILYRYKHVSDIAWIEDTVKNDWPVAGIPDYDGAYPRMVQDASGLVHMSFHDLDGRSLEYAKRTPGLGWQKWELNHDSTSSYGRYSSIALGPGDVPHIAYADDIKDYLKLAEQVNDSTWTLSILDSTDVTGNAQPCQILFGLTGEPWIAYNQYSGITGIRIMFRVDSVWYTAAVAGSGQVGNAFGFGAIGKDIMVAGRKNEPGNSGIGFLRSEGALSVDRIKDLLAKPISDIVVYPNPFSEQTTVAFTLNRPGKISYSLVDPYGRKIRSSSESSARSAGQQSIVLNAAGLSSGVYFLILETETGKFTHKIMVSR